MRSAPEKLIFCVIGAAFLAALALGALAFFLSRHEEAFRTEELRNSLRTECRFVAEQCSLELLVIRNLLEERSLRTTPQPEEIRKTVSEEPFFVNGFLVTREGKLLYSTEKNWNRRFEELFTEFVRPETQADTLAPSVQQAVDERNRIVPEKLLESPRTRGLERNRSILIPQTERSERLSAAPLLPRFAALTYQQQTGFIPYFSGNRFTPLVWAASPADPDLIVGFELEGVLLWSKLIPLFPGNIPSYFRLELFDASDRLIHTTGGDEADAETLLVIPFSEQLLPNAQIRGSLVPAQLPLKSFRLGIWLAIATPIMAILLAGILLFLLVRRELRIAAQKTGFVSQVSHELKTPLTSIRMYSELLQTRGNALSASKRERYLQIILEESERLSRLVGNVLDFSRISEKRKRYTPQKIDLAEALSCAVELSRERAQAEGVELCFLPPENPVECTIDRDSLLQVLYNLIDNAFKYAADGKKVELALTANAIHVRDYGPGIPPDCAKRIFRRFYRADSAITASSSGFGLGLSIARAMMRDQGGDLRYQPEHPGCRFIIELPGKAHYGKD